MAQLPEGVTATLDDAFPDSASEQASSLGDSVSNDPAVDVHQERFDKYVPPHRRGHVHEAGDQFVNFRDRKPELGPDPDRVEGADNDKYQRLKLNVNFAVGFDLISKVLRPQFPGWFFHCSGNVNHDHPVSHIVTMIGTRCLQRRIHPGASVLDVYGNPNAAERFNVSQRTADRPKVMDSLVFNYGPLDFIREVNKWGPVEGDNGPRYLNKSLKQAIASGDCDKYDTFQFIHTMYYQNFETLKALLQTPSSSGKKKRILSLMHRHVGRSGSINNGEQEFEVKDHSLFQGGLLKQRNVKTNSVYVHPNWSPVLFSEVKEWFPSHGFPLEMRDRGATDDDGVGLTWECHLVNDDTWIIEMVLCDNRHYTSDEPSFMDLWNEDDLLSSDFMSEPTLTNSNGARTWENRLEWLPAIGTDREFTHLDIVSKPLFESLRLEASGKTRDRKLFLELVRLSKHSIKPSKLFGDKGGVCCPAEKTIDHVIAAFLVDQEKEGKLMEGMVKLKPILREHAESLKFGSSYRDLSFNGLVSVIRSALAVTRSVNQVARHSDPIGMTVNTLDDWLAPSA